MRTEQSESHSESTTKERNSESQSKGSLDVVTEPPVRASIPTPAGAPGATGTSPNQPFGGDESRDDSPNVHDHHKSNGHSIKQGSHASEKDGSSHSKSSTDSRPSDAHKSESNTSTSGGSEKDPGVTASTKTPAGAGGPTGTAPMEAIGDDASRDTSHKTHEHHKHHSHHSAENTSSQKGSEKSSITPKEKSAPSVNSTEDSTNNVLKKSEFDGPNASFSSEIGSKEDPGRVAEQEMFEKNAQRGDVGSMGVKQDSITGGGQFDVLESEEAA